MRVKANLDSQMLELEGLRREEQGRGQLAEKMMHGSCYCPPASTLGGCFSLVKTRKDRVSSTPSDRSPERCCADRVWVDRLGPGRAR